MCNDDNVLNVFEAAHISLFLNKQLGEPSISSCRIAVELTSRYLEVVGSNPARVMGFFLLLLQSRPTFLHQWSVLNQVPQGGASLTVCS